jgi:non-specific serine/threonine protein kinase
MYACAVDQPVGLVAMATVQQQQGPGLISFNTPKHTIQPFQGYPSNWITFFIIYYLFSTSFSCCIITAMLTPQILENFPLYQHTDYKTIQRGQQYFRENRVNVQQCDEFSAFCEVDGHNDNYEVEILLSSKNKLSFACTCPQAEEVEICKHMVAAMLAVTRYLKSDIVQNDWQYRLGQALEQSPRRKTGANVHKYVAIYLLQSTQYRNGPQFFLVPGIVKATEWSTLRGLALPPEEINSLLNEDRSWTKHLEAPYQAVNIAGCLNLPPEGIAFFNFSVNSSGYYQQFSTFGAYLPLLAKMDVPIFLMSERKKIGERVEIINRPVEVRAALARSGENLSLQAGIELDGKVYTSAKANMHLITENPPWVLLGHHIAPVSNPESISLLSTLPLEIPASQEQTFREKYFKQIAERAPIDGEAITWDDVSAQALPRLYLRNEKDKLLADLRFGYGDYEVKAESNPPPQTVLDIPGSWTMARIQRQVERETSFFEMLTGTHFGLKRAPAKEYPYGTFEMRARTHPYDFLMHNIPNLTSAGFEIYGDKDTLGKVNPHFPSIRLNITSGIDWFDLEATVEYGDQQVPLLEIRKALKRGDRYIKLADGSVGQIPENWLERYKHLFDLGQETDGGLRVSDMQLSLLDELLADAAEKEITPEFHRKRERLRTLEGVRQVALPRGFLGELRPYQKAGVDWLHFLREYGFGGILADDMGLGKTIQVLAFLQSIKEQAQSSADPSTPSPASLLVVPKSLLANWQREAEKFTPELRIFEYYGATRKKEPENFNDYDVVLTTYGTMLKDIEPLRKYRFEYAILDEAQAIKNALSQSSKAARLLNAEHRLAITGTPVENNTFELWSQFAFTNPGLLGSMDYFKKEFANPIESRGDGDTAQLLRRMVYPFILRRTKGQVAPELPPRTERLVYTDLEPAQRKLYDHTRERYRAELLGLIDETGMNDARMKILEGLLRLRQICIHPVLVEPTYRGEVAKFEALLETLETLKAEGHKALIFSQFVQTLHLLETEMKKLGLAYTYLDGKTQNRQAQVDLFQNDPSIPFFLISLKAGGVGLNLTAADYVMHLDPWWNPAVEMQAADRAHRIGQDKPVFIYKFIARNTVEEKILELQGRKKELVEQLISAEGNFFKSISREDVQVLFS